MATKQGFVHSGATLGAAIEYTPGDIGLSALDLKAATATFTSTKIPISGVKEFCLVGKQVIVGTTPTTGAANMVIKAFLADGSTQFVDNQTLFATIDLIEAAGTYYTTFIWSNEGPVAAKAVTTFDQASAAPGTPLADTTFLRGASYMQLVFDLTTVVNAGTSSVMDWYLRLGR